MLVAEGLPRFAWLSAADACSPVALLCRCCLHGPMPAADDANSLIATALSPERQSIYSLYSLRHPFSCMLAHCMLHVPCVTCTVWPALTVPPQPAVCIACQPTLILTQARLRLSACRHDRGDVPRCHTRATGLCGHAAGAPGQLPGALQGAASQGFQAASQGGSRAAHAGQRAWQQGGSACGARAAPSNGNTHVGWAATPDWATRCSPAPIHPLC